jgi:hydrogenase maturation protease
LTGIYTKEEGCSTMAEILVIGYGNPLRGDDGVGCVIAEELAKRTGDDPSSRVQVVACHQLSPEMAEEVADTRAVIFVDASVELRPGEVKVSSVIPDQFSPPAFAHTLKPSALLATASELFGQAPRLRKWELELRRLRRGCNLHPW